MRWKAWLIAVAAVVFAMTMMAFAQEEDHDHGHGHAYGQEKEQYHEYDRVDRDHDFYRDHDRFAMRDWYVAHREHLPPGLAERDHLPPGLERQLMVRGTLPPGLRERVYPCPPEMVRVLPPPPPDCEHVLIGGHVVLLNRRNFLVVDVFHFEL